MLQARVEPVTAGAVRCLVGMLVVVYYGDEEEELKSYEWIHLALIGNFGTDCAFPP